jgi:hypothetical protein
MPPSVMVVWAEKFFVARELPFRHGLPHHLLDLALGGHPEPLEDLRMLLLKTSSFMIAIAPSP